MNVVAINSSPSMDKGHTSRLLTPFLQGVQDAGADVTLHYLQKLRIQPCRASDAFCGRSCWYKTPGHCVQHDDLEILLPSMGQADAFIFATPVFFDGMHGLLKTLLDRLGVAIASPHVEVVNGRTRFPPKAFWSQPRRIALIAVCGFPEVATFDPLVTHIRAICDNLFATYAGALLRPNIYFNYPQIDEIYHWARIAGRQFITDGQISREAMDEVSRVVEPVDAFIQRQNDYFDRHSIKTHAPSSSTS